MGLPEQSLDGAYARWLFCFIAEPEPAVAAVARALRPGAALAVNDYFNYRAFTFSPRSVALDRVVRAVQKCWQSRGGDLEIQGRMPAMMRAHGLHITELSILSLAARPGEPLWDWPASFFRNFMPTLERSGLVSTLERDAFWNEWNARANDPDAFVYLPPMIDVIGVKR